MKTALAPEPPDEIKCRICKKVPVSKRDDICPRCELRSGKKGVFERFCWGDSDVKRFNIERLRDEDLK